MRLLSRLLLGPRILLAAASEWALGFVPGTNARRRRRHRAARRAQDKHLDALRRMLVRPDPPDGDRTPPNPPANP